MRQADKAIVSWVIGSGREVEREEGQARFRTSAALKSELTLQLPVLLNTALGCSVRKPSRCEVGL